MAYSGTHLTRLGLGGFTRGLYGDFSGKAEAQQAPVNPRTSGGTGRVYPFPIDRPNKNKVERQPLPEYEVSGPLSRDRKIERFKLPEWDQEAWEASLKTLAQLEKEDKQKRKKKTVSMLLVAMLDL